MNVFLDTSTLFKLYHYEEGTADLDKFLADETIDQLYISEVATIEFYSAAAKKARMNEITGQQANELIKLFEADIENYNLIKIDSAMIAGVKKLLLQYGKEGLRTLDAIQLISAISVREDIVIAKTSDDKLSSIMNLEGLKTD